MLIRRDGATKLYISFVEGNHSMIVVSHVSFNIIEMILNLSFYIRKVRELFNEFESLRILERLQNTF